MDAINSDPLYIRYRNNNQFIVKLPFSTNSQHKRGVKNVEGILSVIKSFIRKDNVGGYIPYAIIQPEIIDNTEAKVVCFDGKAIFLNPHKKGKSGRSPFRDIDESNLRTFAEHVIACLKRRCPAICTRQVLRIDIFGFVDYPGEFICNEVEGYEAQKCATGSDSGTAESKVYKAVVQYWIETLTELVEFHLKYKCRA